MARVRRKWKTGDTCVTDGCTKVLCYTKGELEGAVIGEGIEGRCSKHHREGLKSGKIPLTRYDIDWNKRHYCVQCGVQLCKRTTRHENRNGKVPVGNKVNDLSYKCKVCTDTDYNRKMGINPMNKRRVSEDGLSQQCTKCKKWYTYISGSFRIHTVSGKYRASCRHCDAEVQKAHRDANKDFIRIKELQSRYNIDAVELLNRQNNRCAICDIEEEKAPRSRLYVDHDHSCCQGPKGICGQCVRGFLCNHCNLILGMYDDCLETIEQLFGGSCWGSSAIDYLKNWPSKTK